MFNIDIREKMKEKRVFGYEVASKMKMAETAFSRKLARRELTEEEKARIFEIIDELAKGELT